VGDLLQAVERQEAAGPLDRVDRAEDARQPLAGVGLLLEGDQVGVQLVEVLMTLDEELLDDVVQTVHGALLSRPRRSARFGGVIGGRGRDVKPNRGPPPGGGRPARGRATIVARPQWSVSR
jgi:hypothetical protein